MQDQDSPQMTQPPPLPFPMTWEEEAAYRGLQMLLTISHRTANEAGWYRDPQTGESIKRNFGEVVALMHSELSEALEADRKNLASDKLPGYHGIEEEFADPFLRVGDTAKANGYDVAAAAILKNRFNKQRADHRLASRAQAGGKRY